MNSPRTTEHFPSTTRDALAAAGGLKADALHPTTATMVRRMARYGGLTDKISVGYARRAVRQMMPLLASRPPVAGVVDRVITGQGGPISIRIVTPLAGDAPRPAIVWFPGGGFVIGDLDTAEPTARSLASRTGAVVICVDYRKAPEHTFDDGYDDAVSATRWVIEHGAGLGVDPRRVGVGGDSAGGNVAAVVAQEHSADGSQTPLALQLLVYPSVSVENEPARALNTEGSTLDAQTMRWFEGHTAGAYDPDSPRPAPLVTDDLSALPPTIVVTAGYDPLRDEALSYLDRLREAGVRAELLHYPDEVHGFFAMDLALDNANVALDASADLAVDMFGLEPVVLPNNRAGLHATLSEFARTRQNQLNLLLEPVTHLRIRSQRRLIRFLGLPAGRDIEAVDDRIKRLELQVRSLRRQLEHAQTRDGHEHRARDNG